MPETPPRIILASQSPRRLALLTDLGLPVTVLPADVDESGRHGEEPEAQARRLALEKAEVAAAQAPDALVIAADTLVVLDGKILGKPRTAEDALSMLMRLRNRQHMVYTGLVLLHPDAERECVQLAATPVLMRNYSELEMRAYVNSGDPLDKAGAYAIQSETFYPVQRLDGCYANVVGLPLCHLYRAMAVWDLAPPRHPLTRCPWPLQNGGCGWAGPILQARPR
ncbi:MAG: Maf family protein [Anaerolineae bacterium]